MLRKKKARGKQYIYTQILCMLWVLILCCSIVVGSPVFRLYCVKIMCSTDSTNACTKDTERGPRLGPVVALTWGHSCEWPPCSAMGCCSCAVHLSRSFVPLLFGKVRGANKTSTR